MQFLISIVSVLYILFLPGFFLSFVFFKHGTIDPIERLALSFGLSIAVVPLVAFYSRLLGIPITSPIVMIEATVIILITGIILSLTHMRKKS
jgi:uncharacterized membrane protein